LARSVCAAASSAGLPPPLRLQVQQQRRRRRHRGAFEVTTFVLGFGEQLARRGRFVVEFDRAS
jgi:hypothetical protein